MHLSKKHTHTTRCSPNSKSLGNNASGSNQELFKGQLLKGINNLQ